MDEHEQVFAGLRDPKPRRTAAPADVTAVNLAPPLRDSPRDWRQVMRGLGDAGFNAAETLNDTFFTPEGNPFYDAMHYLITGKPQTGPTAVQSFLKQQHNAMDQFWGRPESRGGAEVAYPLGLLAGSWAMGAAVPEMAPKPGPRLFKDFEIMNSPSQKLMSFGIEHQGKEGSIHGYLYPDGEFNIGDIHFEGGPGSLGIGNARKILAQLREQEPSIKSVSGFRVSGARMKAADEARLRAPLQEGPPSAIIWDETLEKAYPQLQTKVQLNPIKKAFGQSAGSKAKALIDRLQDIGDIFSGEKQ